MLPDEIAGTLNAHSVVLFLILVSSVYDLLFGYLELVFMICYLEI